MNRRQIVSIAAAALLVAALVPASAFAQSFEAGAKGGINVATVSINGPSPNPSISSRKGGIFGGYVAKDWKKTGVAVEVLWSQKGAHLDFSQTGQIATIDAKFDYVEIPVLFRYNVPYNKTVMHIYAGPVFGFTVKRELVQTSRTTTQTTPPHVETKKGDDTDVKTSDTGIAIGVQVDVHKFLVDVRYNWGLVDIDKDSDSTAKNRCFSAMFGFRFR